MPVVGIAEVLVKPVFNGVQQQIARQMDGASERAGRSAGNRMGRGMSRGFAQGAAVVTAGLTGIVPAAGAASSAALAAGGSVITLTTSLSSLAGVAALVPAGLMSVAAGAGVIVTAFSGMGEALKTAVDASSAVVATNPRLAAMAVEDAMRAISDAESNAADARESAARRVEDAQRSLADAEESAAAAREDAARRIADAQRALADAIESAAEARVAAAKAIEMAERSEERTARDVIKAQKELVKAREDAAEKLNRVSGALEAANRRAVETAEAYRKASALYEAAKADPSSHINELAQLERNATVAAATDKAAKQSVVELRDLHTKAQADAQDANDRVLDAEQRLADARQAQVDAIQGRKDAQADAAKQEVRGAQRVADAQQGVTDATKEAEKSTRDAARNIADAQRAVADATKAAGKSQIDAARAVEDAYRGLERAQMQQADSGALAGKKAAAAMDNLTPSAREAARALLAVYDQLGGIRRIAQESFFKGFTAPLLSLARTIMPQLATGVGAIASAMGAGAQKFMGALESALGGGVLESLLKGVARSTQTLNRALAPVVASFTTLGVVGMPYMERLAGVVADVAERFNGFIQTTAADGRLVGWIDAGIQTLKDLWSIAGSVIGVFMSLSKAAEAGGLGTTVGMLAAGMRDLDTAMQSDTFQTTMATIFGGAAAGAEGLRGALDNIAGAFVRGAAPMAEFMRLGGQIAGTFIGGIFDAFSDPTFGAGLLTFMGGLQRGVEAIAPRLPDLFEGFGQLLTALAPLAEVLGPSVVSILTGFAKGLAAVITFLSPVLVSIASSPPLLAGMVVGIGLLVVAWKLLGLQALIAGGKMALAWLLGLGPVGLVIGAVLALVGIIILNWDKISAFTRDMWEKHVRPVFDALGNFITKDVPKAFEQGVGFIKTAWEKLQDIAKAPVKFVVETVINDGLINGLNNIGGFLNLPKIPRLGLPPGFMNGGYTGNGGKDEPAGIVHGGEFVFTKEQTRRAGVSNLYAMAKSLAGYANGGFVNPLKSLSLTQGYNRIHKGVDFAAGVGTPVFATENGRVSWSGPGIKSGNVWGGNEIHIDGASGIQEWFAHLSSMAVRVGDMVRAGQQIGLSGNTGITSGPHLHFGTFQGGWPNDVNPLGYLSGAGTPSGGGFNPLAAILDGMLSNFKSAFPGGGFMADLAIGVGKKLFGGVADLITGGQGSAAGAALYDLGGILPPGVSQVVNRTGKPEAILNPQQWADVHRIATSGGGRGDVIIKGNVGWDPHEVADRIDTKRRDTFAAFGI